jgi:hypothetical protein
MFRAIYYKSRKTIALHVIVITAGPVHSHRSHIHTFMCVFGSSIDFMGHIGIVRVASLMHEESRGGGLEGNALNHTHNCVHNYSGLR